MIACLKDFTKSTCLLILYLIYHSLSFSITTSFSIGTAILFVFIFENWLGAITEKTIEVPQYIILCLTFWLMFGGIRLNMLFILARVQFRAKLKYFKRKFPFTLQVVPWIFYICFTFGCFYQLQYQYEITHADLSNMTNEIHYSSAVENMKSNLNARTARLRSKYYLAHDKTKILPYHAVDYTDNITLFVFSLAGLVYITVRFLQWDMIKYFRRVPIDRDYEFLKSTVIFLLWQLGVTIGYAFPLLNFFVFFYVFRPSHTTIFFQLNFIAVLIGICGGFIESREPFPVQAGQEPLYHRIEDQARARVIFLQFGLLLIPYFFFSSGITQEFDSSDSTFVEYLMTVALTLLHVIKTITSTYILNKSRRRRHMKKINESIVWFLQKISRNSRVSPATSVLLLEGPQCQGNAYTDPEILPVQNNLQPTNLTEVQIHRSKSLPVCQPSNNNTENNNNNCSIDTQVISFTNQNQLTLAQGSLPRPRSE